jgi:hypothetical protein
MWQETRGDWYYSGRPHIAPATNNLLRTALILKNAYFLLYTPEFFSILKDRDGKKF